MRAAANRSAFQEPIFTRDFLLTCIASVGIFAGMAFLMPVLPLYVVRVGGARPDVGLVIAVFAITSVILRPFLGRLVDRRGAKGVLWGGIIIIAISSALYAVVPSVPLLVALRALHGVGMGAATTAAWALVADYAPAARRGEAMGYFGMFLSGCFAVGPMVGTVVVEAWGFSALFAALTGVAILALLVALPLQERPKPAGHGAKTPPLFARSAFLPALVFFCISSTFAPIGAFLPLLTEDRGMGAATAGIFFSLQAVAIFLSRIVGGKVSDRYGRIIVVLPGMAIIVVGMVVLAFAPSTAILLLAGFIHGSGVGSVQPAVLALAVDRAPEHERGAAMATVTSAMDLGIGLMSVPLGMLLEATNFTTTYLASAGITLVGLVVFGVLARRQGQRGSEVQPLSIA